jgi:hypothetical protein
MPVIGASLVAVALRARFVVTPITSDEGGYLAIARAWRNGAALYLDVWVDRPQGLLVLYALLDSIGLGTPEGVRILAIGACLVAVAACSSAAAVLAGERARAITALLVAVLLGVPQYEAFIANAELLSCAIGAASLAVGLRATWQREIPDVRGVLLAGLLGGLAISVKQSAFDAFAAATVAVMAMVLWGRWSRRDRVIVPLALAGGFSLPLAALALHGLTLGWDRWWYAVVGYRASERSAIRNADWARLGYTWDIVAPVVASTLGAGIVGAVIVSATSLRSRHAVAVTVLGTWWTAAIAAFLIGGQFHRHYWVILAIPLATTTGVVLSRVNSRSVRLALVAVAIAGPTVATATALRIERQDVGVELHGDGRLVHDETLAAWFEQHARPGDTLLPLCASAGFFGNVSIDPPYPYLWFDGVLGADTGQELLASTLLGDDGPRFVAQYQRLSGCDPSGSVGRVLAQHYSIVATVDGVDVLERK